MLRAAHCSPAAGLESSLSSAAAMSSSSSALFFDAALAAPALTAPAPNSSHSGRWDGTVYRGVCWKLHSHDALPLPVRHAASRTAQHAAAVFQRRAREAGRQAMIALC